MRWTPLLLLASACSHTKAQPPPAPLSVSAEKAAGPADLPDAAVEDAGTPDAGSVDGGAARTDLVSPITAAGSEMRSDSSGERRARSRRRRSSRT